MYVFIVEKQQIYICQKLLYSLKYYVSTAGLHHLKGAKMDIDSLEHHIRTLDNQHTMLERKLDAMFKQKSWNEFEAEELKKQKLKIKDELSRMYRRRYDMLQEHQYE